MHGIRFILVVAAVSLLVPAELGAQYFGRNKVEYQDFDFRVLSTPHFDIYYYPREEEAARLAARMAERWYRTFSHVLHHELDRKQPIVLYGSQAEFAQTNVIFGQISDTIGGVTESAKRRIAMPFAPTLAETDRVLGHEIVHAFQFDIARRHGGGTNQPLWFIEGMAEYLARGGEDAEATLWLRDVVLTDRFPARERDAARDLSPYHYGHAFWSYLTERFGDPLIERLLKSTKPRKFEDRIRAATGESLDELYAGWRAYASALVHDRVVLSTLPRTELQSIRAFGRMQIGPAISPDGRRAIFFSERDRLSLDLFLADLDSGRIIRKLASTTASANYDSLQQLRSSGAWSHDGEWFAFAAVKQGNAALILHHLADGRRTREIVFDSLGQVLSPTWSPDGTAIAFSALSGGLTDLFVVDLKTEAWRRLTADAYADLHPAWSPDGRTIAFSTERYSSDRERLIFGKPQIAVLDLASGVVSPCVIDLDVTHVNPQWSADGRELFYVANPDHTGNVFRRDLAAGTTEQLTNVDTGVAGVTPTSPLLSAAARSAALAFTIYRGGRYQLTTLRADGGLAVPSPTSLVSPSPAAPSPAAPAPVDPTTFVSRPYASRMSLERIGDPYVSSGGGPFGNFVRGGASFLFGDMLGERRIGAAVQIGNRLRDAAFEALYLNQERRWNWGALAELEPAARRYRRVIEVDHQGEPSLQKQADYLHRIQLRAAGLVAYPFSRGLRVEFTGGVRREMYRRSVRSQTSSMSTGRVLEEVEEEVDGGLPTTVGEVSGALVGDTTVFGATGPILGSRFRLEVAPAMGSLAYTRVLLDYRKYLMPIRPYAIAIRGLHSGRYGSGGDDPRLLASFLGSRYFVRGHTINARDCQPDPTRACGDYLRGHKLAVANVELRFPLWGMFTRQVDYGPLPADAFLFADSGMVWAANHSTFISSLGAGIRLNAGGLPFEIAAVRALDGPTPRWMLDFGFRVGF